MTGRPGLDASAGLSRGPQPTIQRATPEPTTPQNRVTFGRLDKLDERPPTPRADLGRLDKLDHRSPSPSRGPQPTTQRDASTSASARTGQMALATAPQVQSDVSTSSTNDPQHPREPRPPRQTRPPVPEPVEGSATPTRRFHQGRPQCRRAIGRLDKLDERPPTPSADLGRPDKLDHRSPSPSRGPQPTTQRDASTSASARTGRAAVATAPLGNRTSRQARRTTPDPLANLERLDKLDDRSPEPVEGSATHHPTRRFHQRQRPNRASGCSHSTAGQSDVSTSSTNDPRAHADLGRLDKLDERPRAHADLGRPDKLDERTRRTPRRRIQSRPGRPRPPPRDGSRRPPGAPSPRDSAARTSDLNKSSQK